MYTDLHETRAKVGIGAATGLPDMVAAKQLYIHVDHTAAGLLLNQPIFCGLLFDKTKAKRVQEPAKQELAFAGTHL